MNTERWREIERVFECALELEGERRVRYLEDSCRGDEDLRLEVETLLAAGNGCAEAIQQAVRAHAEEVALERTNSMSGQKIGPYRVLELIGSGGMGAVYLAVRDDDFSKRVAIKLIHQGMASDAVVSRFRRERQILALLEHPCIARLHDGGTSQDGRPYFVMEYVEGQPLTKYCEQRRLGVRERVELFRRVCEAVQHAHSRLIVHRDIKPGNILVADSGVPKLLDFGLAKLLDPAIEEGQTSTFVRMLTPHYASPEQIRGEPSTTATDIYSLGAVLYELLTGARVHGTAGTSISAIEHAICEREPERPSKINRDLDGDLDNIVLTALRIDPERRYRSVEQFSEDLRRYLAGLPVIARQDAFWYRARKFVRRNLVFLSAGTAVAASLIIGAAAATIQAQRAQRRFEHVHKLAHAMLFELNDKVRILPGSREPRQLMVKTGLEYLDGLARETGMNAELAWELARGYERVATLQSSPDPAEPTLGLRSEGLDSYRRAMELARHVDHERPNDPEVQLLIAKAHLGIAWNSKDPAERDRLYDETIALAGRLEGKFPQRRWEPDGPPIVAYLGQIAKFWQSGLISARGDFRRAIQLAGETGPHLGPNVIVPALHRMGDLDGAVKGAHEYIEARKKLLARSTDDILTQANRTSYARAAVWAANALAVPFDPNLGRPEPAKRILAEGTAVVEQAILRDPQDIMARRLRWQCRLTLGDLLAESDPARAVQLYAEGMGRAQGEEVNTAARRELAAAWRIVYPLLRLGRREEALKHARRAVEIAPSPRALLALAEALAASKDAGAEEQFRKAIEAAEMRAADRPQDMHARNDLGEAYERVGTFVSTRSGCAGARKWYALAVNTWRNWPNFGVSSAYNIRREREGAALLKGCPADSEKARTQGLNARSLARRAAR